MEKSIVNFRGRGNILFCEKGVKLVNTNLTFCGNNAVIFLAENKNDYYLTVAAQNDTVFFMDTDCRIVKLE